MDDLEKFDLPAIYIHSCFDRFGPSSQVQPTPRDKARSAVEKARREKIIAVEKARREKIIAANQPYQSLSSEKRKILETLDLLEEEVNGADWIQLESGERFRKIWGRLATSRERLILFGEDQRFNSDPVVLQREIDTCRMEVDSATKDACILTTIINDENIFKSERELERLHRARIDAQAKAKEAQAEQQRVANVQKSVSNKPYGTSPDSSGIGCILSVVCLVAFVAALPFILEGLALLLPIAVTGVITYSILAGNK